MDGLGTDRRGTADEGRMDEGRTDEGRQTDCLKIKKERRLGKTLG